MTMKQPSPPFTALPAYPPMHKRFVRRDEYNQLVKAARELQARLERVERALIASGQIKVCQCGQTIVDPHALPPIPKRPPPAPGDAL